MMLADGQMAILVITALSRTDCGDLVDLAKSTFTVTRATVNGILHVDKW